MTLYILEREKERRKEGRNEEREGERQGGREGGKTSYVRRVTWKSRKLDYFQRLKWSKISKDLQRSSLIRLKILSEAYC